MSKLIVEMEMPQACPCEFAYYSSQGIFRPCFAWYGIPARWSEVEKCAENGTRPDWCPIVGVLPDEPTVDAVPVVRCMECKYMRESVDGLFKSGYFCERCHITSDMENCDDFYCADGERRTDEQQSKG